MSDETIFQELSVDQPVLDPLEELVGEGKRYATPADLAKAKKMADAHIDQIQRENAELREKVSSQATIDEILTRIRESSQPPQRVEPDTRPQNQAPATPEDIKTIVSDLFAQQKTTDKINANVRQVEAKVKEVWKSDAQININNKAKELGVSVDYLQKVAKESPSAFFRLVDLDRPASQVQPTVAPRGTQTTTQPQTATGQKRNNAYYQDMKTKNFQEYISPKMQNQMMKDAISLGKDFYD